MRHLTYIIILFSLVTRAQDKVFFRNGHLKTGIVISISKELVYFKTSDTSRVEQFQKSDILLIEDYRGATHVFSGKEQQKKESNPEAFTFKRNTLALQPFSIFIGRATLIYERLSEDGKVGIVLPLTLTFDPFGPIFPTGIDTGAAAIKRIEGVSFIAGLDLNFYVGRKTNATFFMGPRLRYGTDLFLREVEAYTLQTQLGWRFGPPQQAFVQHFSVGFGIANIISAPTTALLSPKQFYGWYSVNYRLGFRW
jgi:hypothetical protein